MLMYSRSVILKAEIRIMDKINPNGNSVSSMQEIGELVRDKRKQDGLTQTELAELSQVGTRFLSELENGKTTLRFDKVIQVLQNLGLQLNVTPR